MSANNQKQNDYMHTRVSAKDVAAEEELIRECIRDLHSLYAKVEQLKSFKESTCGFDRLGNLHEAYENVYPLYEVNESDIEHDEGFLCFSLMYYENAWLQMPIEDRTEDRCFANVFLKVSEIREILASDIAKERHLHLQNTLQKRIADLEADNKLPYVLD